MFYTIKLFLMTFNIVLPSPQLSRQSRQMAEKMSMGALLLEGDNYEFWLALGCLSDNNALNQHALIRALQLNVSLAVAWGYLGKVLSYVISKQ